MRCKMLADPLSGEAGRQCAGEVFDPPPNLRSIEFETGAVRQPEESPEVPVRRSTISASGNHSPTNRSTAAGSLLSPPRGGCFRRRMRRTSRRAGRRTKNLIRASSFIAYDSSGAARSKRLGPYERPIGRVNQLQPVADRNLVAARSRAAFEIRASGKRTARSSTIACGTMPAGRNSIHARHLLPIARSVEIDVRPVREFHLVLPASVVASRSA